jgi:hypothetical protein
MKMNATLKIATLVLLSILFSCEGNTDRIRTIQNNTSGTIQVIADGNLPADYNKTIPSGGAETLFISGQLGGSDFIENPAEGIHSLIILNAFGDTCVKDYLLQSNWSIDVQQTKRFPSNWRHEYTFSITDSDF